MSPDQEVELERQIGCVVKRIRKLLDQKAKGSLTVHFDGSGLLGRTFTRFISLRIWRSPILTVIRRRGKPTLQFLNVTSK